MLFHLTIQTPRVEKHPEGKLDISASGEACFFDKQDNLIARLKRIRLEEMGADGMILSGFVSDGFDRQGKEKFRYSVWYLYHPIE